MLRSLMNALSSFMQCSSQVPPAPVDRNVVAVVPLTRQLLAVTVTPRRTPLPLLILSSKCSLQNWKPSLRCGALAGFATQSCMLFVVVSLFGEMTSITSRESA